jgi:pyruvate/2-oxoglutarate dehydrogenase complex dihydrolipoamide acyltransferase (E2) component
LSTTETVPLVMPSMGNGVDTATVGEWLIGVGESVEAGEPVVIIETDKASSEIELPFAGTLVLVHVEDGGEIEVGAVLGDFAPA